MTRVLSLVTLILALLAAPLAAEAQPAGKVYRIGVLSAGHSPDRARSRRLRQGLREPQLRRRGGTSSSSPARRRGRSTGSGAGPSWFGQGRRHLPSGTPGSFAAKRATARSPSSFGVADPVGAGLITSLARPGGNITGLTTLGPDLVGKQLELLKEIVPRSPGWACCGIRIDPGRTPRVEELRRRRPTMGLTLIPFEVRSPDDFENAF